MNTKSISSRLKRWANKPLSKKIQSVIYLFNRFLSLCATQALRTTLSNLSHLPSLRGIYYRSLPPNNILIAKTKKLSFAVNTSDVIIGHNTYVKQVPFESEKLEETISILKKANRSIDLLIDIGANIGTIGLTAVASGLTKRCIAFEPEPGNFNLLKANIYINDLADKIVAHNVAISDGTFSELEMELDNLNHGDHRIRVSSDEGLFSESSRTTIKVKAFELDYFMKDFSSTSSLIWMDTQGFEGYVLSGSKKLITLGLPIVSEFWPYGLKRANCFDLFIDSINHGNYSSIVILDGKQEVKKYNKNLLLDLANQIGFEGSHTDILIF